MIASPSPLPLIDSASLFASAIKIYADAFGKDAKFFKFYRSMLAYEKTFVDKDTTMILSPESEFFDFFSDKKGN